MLARLFLVLLLSGALFAAYRWWRAYRAERAGMLDAVELRRLYDLARRSHRLAAAAGLRVQIIEATPPDGKRELSVRLDQAMRRLMRQEMLREQITQNLSEASRARQVERIAQAQTTADRAENPDERRQKESVLASLTNQLEQLDRLDRRRGELEDAGDRMVAELKTIHLAMLEASSTELSLSEGRVGGLLRDLEETSEQIRQKVQAHDEVEKMLATARQTEKL